MSKIWQNLSEIVVLQILTSFCPPDFPRALPKGFWTTKSAGLKTLNLPYGFVWPGWPGPKIPKSYWEARLKENHKENGGGLQPRFSPNLSTRKFGKKKNKSFLFFPQGLWGEFWGKILVENPHFPYGFIWRGPSSQILFG